MPGSPYRTSHIVRKLLIFLCALSLVSCAPSGASDPQVMVLAAVGEAAPGLSDDYILEGISTDYTMGASGHVAFTGSANIANGAARDRVEAFWFGTAKALKPIATAGDAVPGLDADVLISGFEPTPWVITKSGRLGFVARVSRWPPGHSPQALLVHHDGELVKAVASGDTVPLATGEAQLLSISQFAMSDAGVLFMGKYARNQSGLWFWDYSKLRLVMADRERVSIGPYQCDVRSVASTSLDVNKAGLAVFRVSLVGNECPRGGIVAWDARSGKLIPVAMNRTPVSEDSDLYFQSVTGDARVNDDGNVALHANIYSNSASASGAREMTLMQRKVGGDSTKLLDISAPLPEAADFKLTHTILGDGLALVDDRELIHFVKSNRDRIILRSAIGDDTTHSVVAHTGTAIGEQIAARIGDAHVNRRGDVVFTSFIDDGPEGGTYQQELWFSGRKGNLTRLAYAGQPVSGRADEVIERIDSANQSHEPGMHSTQGGRMRRIDDSGAFLFSGRLKKGSQWHNALFVASPN